MSKINLAEMDERIENLVLDELEKIRENMSDDELEEFLARDEEDLGDYHFSLGLWIRNNLTIFETDDYDLETYLPIKLGIWHWDDQSDVFMRLLHRYLKGRDLGLEPLSNILDEE